MKIRALMYVTAAAIAAPAFASTGAQEQEVDPSRVAELRCQLVGICEGSVQTEDGGIEGETTRGGSFHDLKKKVGGASTATTAAPVVRQNRPQQSAALTRPARPVASTGGGRSRPAATGAVAVSESVKGSADLFVTFARGSDQLVPSARQDIKELAQVLALPNAEGKQLRLMIAGHTDATGEDDRNKELSAKRAEAVRDALIVAGVKPEQLEAVGYGEERLRDPSKPNDGINRRVEAVVID